MNGKIGLECLKAVFAGIAQVVRSSLWLGSDISSITQNFRRSLVKQQTLNQN